MAGAALPAAMTAIGPAPLEERLSLLVSGVAAP